jgi:hypothetical protein
MVIASAMSAQMICVLQSAAVAIFLESVRGELLGRLTRYATTMHISPLRWGCSS